VHALLARLGRWCARRYWVVLVVWIVVLVGLLVARNHFGGVFANDYTVPGSSSARGADVLKADFPQQSGYAGQIVFAAPAGQQIAAATDAVNQSVANVTQLPHVVAATSPFAVPNSPLVSRDGRIAYATVSFDVVPSGLGDAYRDSLDRAVKPARDAGLSVEYGGGAGQIGQSTKDLRSEAIGLSLALVLLLIMFGSLVAALVPLLSATAAVFSGLALLGLLAAAYTLPTTAPTVATLLGLGVAVDYGLFLVARHREGLDAGTPAVRSIGEAAATSGAAVVVAGSTVVIAILGLYLSGVPFVGALGGASAVMVILSMVAALTLVLALLGLMGRHIRSLRARLRERTRRRQTTRPAPPRTSDAAHPGEQGVFARWGRAVSAHPWPWAIGATVLLLVLAAPVLSIRFGQIDASADPTSQTDRRAYDLISEGFGPGANGPITVVVSVPAGQAQADTQSMLTNLQNTLTSTAGVAGVGAPVLSSSGHTALLTVTPTTAPQAEATTDLVDRIRDTVLPTVPATTYLTGTTAGSVDFTDRVVHRLPLIIGVVVLLALLVLTVAFRSLAIGIKAAAMNLVSVAASYGFVVAVFQWGWGSSLIGLDEKVPIPAFVPMFMFAIIFGLSMDYEVFLLSRVHESYQATGDERRSVAVGIGATARVISTAAAVMIVVFSSFVLDNQAVVKMLALGMAFSVLIDASVVRMILVPALMTLLGARAWWIPRWLDRVVPNVSIEGGRPAQETRA
jgi:putative drug exporter of the RND superfamily